MIKVTPDLWVPRAWLEPEDPRETPDLWDPLDSGARRVTEDCLALRECPDCRGEMEPLAWQGKLVKKDQKVKYFDDHLGLPFNP